MYYLSNVSPTMKSILFILGLCGEHLECRLPVCAILGAILRSFTQSALLQFFMTFNCVFPAIMVLGAPPPARSSVNNGPSPAPNMTATEFFSDMCAEILSDISEDHIGFTTALHTLAINNLTLRKLPLKCFRFLPSIQLLEKRKESRSTLVLVQQYLLITVSS